MKRRVFAVILALAMLIPAFAVSPDAAETGKLIEWNEPAIPADEGEIIDLSAYSVRFAENEEPAEGIEWEYEGKTVTSFTPVSAGVYTLTAKSGGKEKNVYVHF